MDTKQNVDGVSVRQRLKNCINTAYNILNVGSKTTEELAKQEDH